jgi:fused signal recognition particle receptor
VVLAVVLAVVVVVVATAAVLGGLGLRRRAGGGDRLGRRGPKRAFIGPAARSRPPSRREPVVVDPTLVAEVEAALANVEVEAPPAPPEAPPAEAPPAPPEAPPAAPEAAPLAPAAPRLVERLAKARALLQGGLAAVRGRPRVDDAVFEELEETLIRADVGVRTTTALLDELRTRVKHGELSDPDELVGALKDAIKALLEEGDRELHLTPEPANVWLFVGVNGVGKTTTIAKVAKRELGNGRSVVVAAGDTFRAAAIEQLEAWVERVGADIVRGTEGGDPGAVVFDAVQRAAARGADLVLADTAGRLHTKANLMEELKKVRRVADRPPGHVSEVLLVLDATTGQNGLAQAREFAEATGVTGVVLTKLDGTAKGGIVVAIRAELGIPIKLVGVGEGADDLVEFDPDEFVEALFA